MSNLSKSKSKGGWGGMWAVDPLFPVFRQRIFYESVLLNDIVQIMPKIVKKFQKSHISWIKKTRYGNTEYLLQEFYYLLFQSQYSMLSYIKVKHFCLKMLT